MSAALSPNEVQELRRLIPLNTLSADRFEEICPDFRVEEAPKGAILFQQGDTKNEFVYVLGGTISLQAGGIEMDSVVGGSESARFALAHQIPRKVSAVAKEPVRFLRVKPEWINQREDSRPSYQVSDIEIEAEDDWIGAILRLPIFQRLPPANLQAFLRTVEEIRVPAGQVICRQDEPGDYYYIIKKGQCVLSRRPTKLSKEIKLATLKKFDSFGEDALISGQPRTVTVTMQGDGVLLRLEKANFVKLIKDPLVSHIKCEAAKELVRQGAEWLDVRLPDVYQQGHLPGSRNSPFFSLRMALPTLDRQRKYILVCEDGKLSEAAAFLLLRYGFQAQVLKDGIGSLAESDLVTEVAEKPPTPAVRSDIQPGVARLPEVPAAKPISAFEDQPPGVRPLREASLPVSIPFAEGRPAPQENDVAEAELAVLRGRIQDYETTASEAAAREKALAERLAASETRLAESAAREQALAERLTTRETRVAEITARENTWAERLAASEQRTADADTRIRKLEAAAAADAELRAKTPPAADANPSELATELETTRVRLAHAEQELHRLEIDFRRTFDDRTRADTRAEQARAAEEKAKSALSALQREHTQLLEERAELSGNMPAGDVQSLERELTEMKAAYAELLNTKEALEEQASELQTVVEEFLDHGASTPPEEMEALRTELDMLHQQASAELTALQSQLHEARLENARLHDQLDALNNTISQQPDASAPQDTDTGKPRSPGMGILWAILGACLLTALILGGLLFLEPGRGLLRQWLAEPAPNAVGTPPVSTLASPVPERSSATPAAPTETSPADVQHPAISDDPG